MGVVVTHQESVSEWSLRPGWKFKKSHSSSFTVKPRDDKASSKNDTKQLILNSNGRPHRIANKVMMMNRKQLPLRPKRGGNNNPPTALDNTSSSTSQNRQSVHQKYHDPHTNDNFALDDVQPRNSFTQFKHDDDQFYTEPNSNFKSANNQTMIMVRPKRISSSQTIDSNTDSANERERSDNAVRFDNVYDDNEFERIYAKVQKNKHNNKPFIPISSPNTNHLYDRRRRWNSNQTLYPTTTSSPVRSLDQQVIQNDDEKPPRVDNHRGMFQQHKRNFQVPDFQHLNNNNIRLGRSESPIYEEIIGDNISRTDDNGLVMRPLYSPTPHSFRSRSNSSKTAPPPHLTRRSLPPSPIIIRRSLQQRDLDNRRQRTTSTGSVGSSSNSSRSLTTSLPDNDSTAASSKEPAATVVSILKKSKSASTDEYRNKRRVAFLNNDFVTEFDCDEEEEVDVKGNEDGLYMHKYYSTPDLSKAGHDPNY